MRLILSSLVAGACFAQSSAAPMSERAVLRIAREVQKGILSLPNYGLFDDIRFAIKGYEVILKGLASRPTLKSSAEQVVKKIEGVEKVTNEIEVLPLSPQDDDIRVAAYVRIYGHPSLSRYNPNRGSPIFRSRASVASGIANDPPPGYHPIHIIVNRGNITLEGVVDTVGDRTIAELQANSTPGAFAVTNNLRVANQEQMSDMKEMRKKK
ncbi:MAG: BON domain-containing protein [Bryobacteraceae bacterium]|nr:BON domain-containing protein [Bryobacteraceae bacterium]